MKDSRWTKSKLLNLLRGLERDHGFAGSSRLNALSRRLKTDLRGRIRRIFGSLREAKRCAGVKEWPLWSDERITKELQAYAGDGTIRYRRLKRDRRALLAAIERRFGSILPAVQMAGVKANHEPIHGPWKYSSEVILTILKEAWHRRDIRVGPLKEKHAGVYLAAVKEFGSWRNALRAAKVPEYAYSSRMAAHRVVLRRRSPKPIH